MQIEIAADQWVASCDAHNSDAENDLQTKEEKKYCLVQTEIILASFPLKYFCKMHFAPS